MGMQMGKSHIDKIQCVENVMTFEPLLLGSISKKCFQNASCARQRVVLSGYFAESGHQCMVEASARLSMCAACVSSALAIT
jgi:hypothetical protein